MHSSGTNSINNNNAALALSQIYFTLGPILSFLLLLPLLIPSPFYIYIHIQMHTYWY